MKIRSCPEVTELPKLSAKDFGTEAKEGALVQLTPKLDVLPLTSTLQVRRGSILRTMRSDLEGHRVSGLAKFREEMQGEFILMICKL